eukprot:jgi/Galph1/3177/GphlegSOOS_G1865.1
MTSLSDRQNVLFITQPLCHPTLGYGTFLGFRLRNRYHCHLLTQPCRVATHAVSQKVPIIFCCQKDKGPQDEQTKENNNNKDKKLSTVDHNNKEPVGWLSWRKSLSSLVSFLKEPLVIPKFLIILLAGSFVTVAITSSPFEPNRELQPLQQKVALFNFILEDIDRAYVEPVNIEKLFETGVNSMLGTLDPYTQFENNMEAQEMNLKTMGRYGGIGLGIAKDIRDNNKITVVSSFEGYAFDAGIRPGDVIMQVDGREVTGSNLEQVTEFLRGEPGSKVVLTVSRQGRSEPFQVELVRKMIRIPDVPAYGFIGNREDGIGYIRLQSFSRNAGAEVRSAVRDLQKTGNLKSLVLDLRDNPGGLLSAAVDVSEIFVPKGMVIVTTKGRLFHGEPYRSTRDALLFPNVRLGVLVNGRTASAAEIVSGAIQDNDLGIIIGSKTFGKGLVQNVEQLPFHTALKYTVGKYYTPSGRCIQSTYYSTSHDKLKITSINEKDRKEFKTKNGRFVLDSGGIGPDVLTPEAPFHELRRLLHQQGAYFYFANDFAAKHSQGIEPDFQVDESVYTLFQNYVEQEVLKGNLSFSSRFDETIAALENELREEGFQGSSKELEHVENILRNEIRNEFVHFAPLICHDLEDAIRARFQPESVRVMTSLTRDEQVVKVYERIIAK